ncbi:LLM class flavin-dependent oxidoreductase [Methylobacterium mesophilicum SR1.6/6]|uniref:LLM class flavin-dependent oxidoreductase n=1 Tax=Methylobacterium mesophilicum SR1.6/6 TaxID=908290 RepID=A0A6B9FLC1_9HYPH|nr:LLM class flavin-dependent oxidoreductase [Methylobacterium mesophilicum]QGY01925.1 LLM class flavin-dependent oxidoreductase [Methylobacterium mesophilicum SR1.6/6]
MSAVTLHSDSSEGLEDVGIRARSPADFPDSPLAQVLRQPFLLGLFLPIQNGGWSPSTLPRTTDWSFDYNVALTRKAEELGFDLVFGLAQWIGKGGYGGELRYRETTLDPFVTVAALSSVTSRILLISTIHILYGPWHPLHLAKFAASLDHISKGRFGLNVVTGYAPREPRMFGMTQIEHDERYMRSAEFAGMLERLWGASENVTVDGRYWRLEEAYVTPKPAYGRPILVNATGSPAGFAYAAAHSDLAFVTSPAGADIDAAIPALPDHIGALKAQARAVGREIRTIINPMIVCRPTEKEARDYHAAILAHADADAVRNFVAHHAAGDSRAWTNHRADHRVLGGNVQIIGSPEQVVEKLVALKATGIDGAQLTFFDFAPDLAFFGEAVLPLLKQAGLRL